MKHTLPLLVLLAMLALPASASAQMALTPTPLDYVDAQIDVFLPALAEYQDAYFVDNGAYFQALESHSTPPEGVEAPDGLYTHPTDQTAALAEVWDYSGLPVETGFAFRVDTYNGPKGPGYVLTVTVDVDGETWRRSINVGPEYYRERDWYHYDPSEI